MLQKPLNSLSPVSLFPSSLPPSLPPSLPLLSSPLFSSLSLSPLLFFLCLSVSVSVSVSPSPSLSLSPSIYLCISLPRSLFFLSLAFFDTFLVPLYLKVRAATRHVDNVADVMLPMKTFRLSLFAALCRSAF